MEEGKTYTVRVDTAVDASISAHAEFLARVSVPAAKRLVKQVYDDIASLNHNPQRCQRHINELFPDGERRYMLSAKRYKIIFEVYEELGIVHTLSISRQPVSPETENRPRLSFHKRKRIF